MSLLSKSHILCGKFISRVYLKKCENKYGKLCCMFYHNVCNKNGSKKEININNIALNFNSLKKKNEFEEKEFNIDDLNKYNLKDEKINFDFLNKMINYILMNKNDHKLNVENLLLLLVVFNKNFINYKDKFENGFDLKVYTNIMSKIKLKLHYLYTSKMLIYTLNILTNLKLIDNDILKSFTNKCDYFIKIEEYEIYDLVAFLRIFSEIYILNKHNNSINFQNFNWLLIKTICDKLTYNFDFLFLPYKDNTFSFKLRKKLAQQIGQLVNSNNNSNDSNLKYDSIEKWDIPIDPNTSESKIIILDTLLSISKSLKNLNYSHIPLSNEISNTLKIHFFNHNKLININDDPISLNKLFYIMNCFLFLQLDYHMFYKYILNNFNEFLKKYKNLLLLFFLLSKNNLFPLKVIHIFDSTFLQNVKQKKYNSQNLIILLETYASHKYRNAILIQQVLNFWNLSSVNNEMNNTHTNRTHLDTSCSNKDEKILTRSDNASCPSDGETTMDSNTNVDKFDITNNKSLYNSLSILDKIKIFYSLFHLDIYEDKLLFDITSQLNSPELIHSIPYKFLIKLLLSFCYFSYENITIYNIIIKNLIKYDILVDNIYLNQLKIIELSLRTQHVPNVYNKLDSECYEYMNYIKNKEKEIEYNIKSDLQKEVKHILLTFNLTPLEEVSIGPYNVDFVEQDQTFQNIYKNEILYQNQQNNCNQIISSNQKSNEHTGKIIIEVNGEHHFYKNTKSYTSFSKLKHKLLSDLGYIVINIPYYDWAILKTDLNKKSYLKKIINDKSNIDMISILPHNQQTFLLKTDELKNIKKAIHSGDAKSQFINNIAEFRNKNKLKFLKKKIKEI
ncbi:RAP protein, putative [Plasmodium vinckei brucechwatti]|uniref:RAP protein, putative n=1 Tax=Plasmodium vinckei brucechwatti TaxID=119398 RepID=A0A6V7SC39_PLAVN|nr:RAP protein, putative [Plasmodium vinckei brucechwatti]